MVGFAPTGWKHVPLKNDACHPPDEILPRIGSAGAADRRDRCQPCPQPLQPGGPPIPPAQRRRNCGWLRQERWQIKANRRKQIV